MTLRRFSFSLAALLLLLVPAAHARNSKSDVYFGYSRAGANLYSPNTPGMNGWQLAMHIKLFPFIGAEGDVSRYGANAGAGSQHATNLMFGPRVTGDYLGNNNAPAGASHYRIGFGVAYHF